MKKSLLLFSLLALILSGCSDTQAKKLKIGISIPAATHGWTGGVVWSAGQAKKNIEAANPDVEVIITTSANTADQVNRIENLLARGVSALVVMAQEPGPVSGICERAKEQGTYLVVVSNPLRKPVEDVFVNGDNRSFGAAAAETMGRLLGGKGDIAVMEGIPCPINTDRVSAFRQVLAEKYPGIRILDSQSAGWNTEKGLTLMENFLQKYKKLDGVWCGDDDVLIGALKAYQESGRKDIRCLVGGGGSKLIVKKVMDRDPLVRGTVTYSPRMLETGANAALEGLRKGRTGRKEIIEKSVGITAENAAKYYYPDSVY